MKLSFLPSILLALAIFGLEIATPRGVAEATLYVLVVLVSLRTADRRFILGMLILCTFLTVAGFFVSAGRAELWQSVANRSLAIIAFWVVGLVGLQHVHMEASLRESKLHYQNVLEHMLEGAQIVGFDWRYLYVNNSLIR